VGVVVVGVVVVGVVVVAVLAGVDAVVAPDPGAG
jgi:hypothetical protein